MVTFGPGAEVLSIKPLTKSTKDDGSLDSTPVLLTRWPEVLVKPEESDEAQNDRADDIELKLCRICGADVEEFQASCGCRFCFECFRSLCKSSTPAMPLLCMGMVYPHIHRDRHEKITLDDIEEVLTETEFEVVLEKRMKSCVQRDAVHLQYCPKADCTQVLPRLPYGKPKTTAPDISWGDSIVDFIIEGTLTQTVICSVCSSAICLSCEAIHSGLTCQEHQDAVASAEPEYVESPLFADCPHCGQACELAEGCSQVQCLVCNRPFTFGEQEYIYDYQSENQRAAQEGVEDGDEQTEDGDEQTEDGDNAGWYSEGEEVDNGGDDGEGRQ